MCSHVQEIDKRNKWKQTCKQEAALPTGQKVVAEAKVRDEWTRFITCLESSDKNAKECDGNDKKNL